MKADKIRVMRNLKGIILLSFICLLLSSIICFAQEAKQVNAAVITCKDMIDDGLYKSIKRRTNEALDGGADYIVYEIDTYGGDLFSAFNISTYFLDEANAKVLTVAYVAPKAISAGAMISVACKDIVMRENSKIGDCAPIQMGGKLEGVEREKVETVTRSAFLSSAQANDYPEALLMAMVTMQMEVYKVENTKTGKFEFFEGEKLPKDKKLYDLENKVLIDKKDELVTLTAQDANEYGVARAVVKDRAGVFDFLENRDGVKFSENIPVFEPNWSEQMVRWINSPAVMSILVLLAMLGVYVEFNSPGVGLPGLVAVICFVIIIGSKYLIGMANWVEVALFVIGGLLLMVELFVTPGFGFIGGAGILCMIAGVFGMLVKNPPDKIPWPQTAFDWQLFTNGVAAIMMGFVGFVVLAWALSKYLPRMQFLSGLILVPIDAEKREKMHPSITTLPSGSEDGVSVGDKGVAVSTLRPAGQGKFEDAIVDVVSQGEFIGHGASVEIIEIHGNRVVVQEVKS